MRGLGQTPSQDELNIMMGEVDKDGGYLKECGADARWLPAFQQGLPSHNAP